MKFNCTVKKLISQEITHTGKIEILLDECEIINKFLIRKKFLKKYFTYWCWKF